MFRTKCVLIMGGSGQLGRETVKAFRTGRFRRWKVFNIDTVENEEAQKNFIIDTSKPITEEVVENLHKELKEFDEEFEAMVNLAGTQYLPNTKAYLRENNIDVHPMSISNPNIFDEYEKVQREEFLSTMLMVHLSDQHLSPTGYMMFVGSQNALTGLP